MTDAPNLRFGWRKGCIALIWLSRTYACERSESLSPAGQTSFYRNAAALGAETSPRTIIQASLWRGNPAKHPVRDAFLLVINWDARSPAGSTPVRRRVCRSATAACQRHLARDVPAGSPSRRELKSLRRLFVCDNPLIAPIVKK